MERSKPRREFIASVAAIITIGAAGCASDPSNSSTSNGTQEASLCTERVSPPSSNTDEDHVIVREYPELPDKITNNSAVNYAKSFEEAFQMNRLANQSSARDYEVKSFINVDSDEVENGFIVSFEISLSWKKDSGGKTVSADDVVAVTYFVSNKTVIRHEGSVNVDPRNEDIGEVVVCK